MTASYDDRQIAAPLVICAKCGNAYYMPSVLCAWCGEGWRTTQTPSAPQKDVNGVVMHDP